jgi:hypothetical protein
MRDMAIDAATVFLAFKPGRLPIVLGFANWLKISRAGGNGRLGVDVCDKSDAGRARNAGSAYGKRQGQVEYAAAFRLEQAIRPDALETSDPPSALLWERITRARVRGPVAQPDRATVS